jgi:BirA family transcriptional regulator, biotin operon repressor / biotin---[acetyl-CoA-carboxylase] ligase
VAAGLAGSRWSVEVLEESPSTNAVVAQRARDGAGEGLVVVADHQSAGRGRLDRTWITPPRSALTFSVLVRPDAVPVARWPWLPLLAGVAVVDGVRRATGQRAVLKWPNDVLLEQAKVAGILVERVEGPAGAAAVVGIGLNVSTTAAELPVASATSLQLAGAGPVDRVELLGHLLTTLGEWYDTWRAARGDAATGLRAAYLDRCDTVGRRVRVQLPGGREVDGRGIGVDAEGRLEVDAAGQGVVLLGAGDVVHVRARA